MAQLSTAMKIGIAGAALAMAAAARKGFQVLSESVELAGVQQIAERKLEQALRNTGDASEESAEQLKKLASEVQNVSNFGDEAIITAQALLLSFAEVGGAQGAALLTPRLADLQAGIQGLTGESTDLNAVTQAVGRALTQGSGALSRYGISMTEAQKAAFNTAEGMEKVRLLSEILDSNFKGLAAATANPFVQAENAIGDLKEALGSELRPELENTARQFTAFIQDDRTVEFAENVGNALVEFGQGVIRFFQFSIPIAMGRLKSATAGAAEGVLDAVGPVAAAIADPIGFAKAKLKGTVITNPFQNLINSLGDVKERSDETVESLINQEIQQSAARIQAEMLAEANRDLAASIQQVNQAQGAGIGSAPSRPGIEVQQQEDIAIDSLAAIPDVTDQSRESVALLIQEMLGLGDALDVVTEKTEENEEAGKGATKAFRGYTAGSIQNMQDLGRAVEGFMQQFIQAKFNEAIAGSAAKEFSTKGLFGAITAGIAAGAVKAFFSQLPGFADGVTGFGGGMALVGERGPELVTLGQGSNVITNENTNKMLQRFDAIVGSMGAPNISMNNSGVEDAINKLGDRIQGMQLQIDYFALEDGQSRHSKQQRIVRGE